MFFSTNASFRVVETDFMVSRNHFYISLQRLLPVKAFLRSSEIKKNHSFWLLVKDFLSGGNCLIYLRVFF